MEVAKILFKTGYPIQNKDDLYYTTYPSNEESCETLDMSSPNNSKFIVYYSNKKIMIDSVYNTLKNEYIKYTMYDTAGGILQQYDGKTYISYYKSDGQIREKNIINDKSSYECFYENGKKMITASKKLGNNFYGNYTAYDKEGEKMMSCRYQNDVPYLSGQCNIKGIQESTWKYGVPIDKAKIFINKKETEFTITN